MNTGKADEILSKFVSLVMLGVLLRMALMTPCLVVRF